MSNFSYAAKVLKAEFCDFLDPVAQGLRRPVAKLLFDLVFDVVASGSAKLSDVARHIGDESLAPRRALPR